MNKETIKKNFSLCAGYYDKYASIQNRSGRQLIAKLETNGFTRILELGCGTGNFTRLLRKSCPQAEIKALDISAEMVAVARGKFKQNNIKFVVADAESASPGEGFSLISSNAALQWFEDLETALSKYHSLLGDRGKILFSLFGPGTFRELNNCLRELPVKGAVVDAANFMGTREIKNILQNIFRHVLVEKKIYRERSASLLELLKKIKYTGVKGASGGKAIFWTSGMIRDLEKLYRRKYKDITASYEVLFCEGVK